MKSIAWMTTDNLASRPHDYEMTLASARSAAHAFLNPTDHRQQETRSQHRWFRTTIMKLKLYFNLHQYIPGQNLPSFCQHPLRIITWRRINSVMKLVFRTSLTIRFPYLTILTTCQLLQLSPLVPFNR